MSFPPRSPSRADKAEIRLDSHRHQAVFTLGPEPEPGPPEPEHRLSCFCCNQTLPLEAFYRIANGTQAREGRMGRCKHCVSTHAQAKRRVNGDDMRASQRERARQREEERKEAGIPRPQPTPEQVKANTQATYRYRARKHGLSVPKQARGTLAVLVKPACRISETCALRRFCTTESKNLA